MIITCNQQNSAYGVMLQPRYFYAVLFGFPLGCLFPPDTHTHWESSPQLKDQPGPAALGHRHSLQPVIQALLLPRIPWGWPYVLLTQVAWNTQKCLGACGSLPRSDEEVVPSAYWIPGMCHPLLLPHCCWAGRMRPDPKKQLLWSQAKDSLVEVAGMTDGRGGSMFSRHTPAFLCLCYFWNLKQNFTHENISAVSWHLDFISPEIMIPYFISISSSGWIWSIPSLFFFSLFSFSINQPRNELTSKEGHSSKCSIIFCL